MRRGGGGNFLFYNYVVTCMMCCLLLEEPVLLADMLGNLLSSISEKWWKYQKNKDTSYCQVAV